MIYTSVYMKNIFFKKKYDIFFFFNIYLFSFFLFDGITVKIPFKLDRILPVTSIHHKW